MEKAFRLSADISSLIVSHSYKHKYIACLYSMRREIKFILLKIIKTKSHKTHNFNKNK